jgi:hypothetical protein
VGDTHKVITALILVLLVLVLLELTELLPLKPCLGFSAISEICNMSGGSVSRYCNMEFLHQVVTAYTVRAKQGKAQLHYLSQGGPGRMSVGGGLRARETRRLFTHICEKLNEWHKEIEGCNLLFYSGNMRVWNEVQISLQPSLV